MRDRPESPKRQMGEMQGDITRQGREGYTLYNSSEFSGQLQRIHDRLAEDAEDVSGRTPDVL